MTFARFSRPLAKGSLVLALCAPLAFPAAPAMAGPGDAIAGGIIGGIIGGAIVKESAKKKQVVRTYRAPAPDPARMTRREVQTALNYFGFPAGTPDGVYGRNTRAAIAQYQVALDYPPTGELTGFQQDFLLSSYQRAELGGANTLALIARTPGGASGLLVAWRDEMVAGGAAGTLPPAPGTLMAAAPAPAAPAPEAAAETPPAAPALPSFLAAAPAAPSLTSHCNQVSMVTGSGGGFATLASMTDPAQALDEQFCLARTYAISGGETLAAGLKELSPAQITQQCASFGPVMAGPVAMLATQPPAAVIPAAAQVAAGTGMAPAQLTSTAKICLSSGYKTDAMDVALGSALLLTALGQAPYAELVGQHLLKGFGTAANPVLARDWFRTGLDALAAGQPAVFAPGQPERVTLMRVLALDETPAPQTIPAFGSGGSGAPATTTPQIRN